MTDKRNDTSHTYKEAVAQAIYESIGKYTKLMGDILQKTKAKGL